MEKISDIKITVGLVTYNRPNLLKEAVHSVLKQSFKNFELIISNDCVESPVTLNSLGIDFDSRIRIINQKSNLGEASNSNYLLEIAQGDWFVWLGDDDLFHPDFLMLANNTIIDAKDKNIVAFYSNYIAEADPVGIFPQYHKSSGYIQYDASRFLLEYTARKTKLVGCYGVMQTAALRRIGGMPRLGNSFGPYSDTLIPVLLVEYGDICWLDEKLVFIRTHAESQSSKSYLFSAYATAEADFIKELRRVCVSRHECVDSDKVIANMVRWFSSFEWLVLDRNPSLNSWAVTMKFIRHQVSVNIPRLSLGYSITHILFMFHFLAKRFMRMTYNAIKSVTQRFLQFL